MTKVITARELSSVKWHFFRSAPWPTRPQPPPPPSARCFSFMLSNCVTGLIALQLFTRTRRLGMITLTYTVSMQLWLVIPMHKQVIQRRQSVTVDLLSMARRLHSTSIVRLLIYQAVLSLCLHSLHWRLGCCRQGRYEYMLRHRSRLGYVLRKCDWLACYGFLMKAILRVFIARLLW